MSNAITNRKQQAISLVENVAKEQATTLAMHNLDVNRFKSVAVEALLSNPNIGKCEPVSLMRAMRSACQDGLVPNGKEACFIPKKTGDVQYLPMLGGICKIAHRVLGATIESGHIREGEEDTIEINQPSQGHHTVNVKPSFKKKAVGEVVGAWALVRVKNQHDFVHIFYHNDIENARKASNMRYPGGPWDLWTGRMAEKAVVKSAVRKVLNMYPGLVGERTQDILENMLDADVEEAEIVEEEVMQEAEIAELEVVDQSPGLTEPEGSQDAPEEQPSKATPQPAKKATPKKAAPKAQAKKEEAKTETIQAPAQEDDMDIDWSIE